MHHVCVCAYVSGGLSAADVWLSAEQSRASGDGRWDGRPHAEMLHFCSPSWPPVSFWWRGPHAKLMSASRSARVHLDRGRVWALASDRPQETGQKRNSKILASGHCLVTSTCCQTQYLQGKRVDLLWIVACSTAPMRKLESKKVIQSKNKLIKVQLSSPW